MVNVARTARDAGLDKMVSDSAALRGAAHSDREGGVLQYAGDIDAETTCAVATLAARFVEELSGELGLGDASSWHVSRGDSTWYVVPAAEGVVVASGRRSSNPATTLRHVEATCRRPPWTKR